MKYSLRSLMITTLLALAVLAGLCAVAARNFSRDFNRYYFPQASP